jgi:hypothetical protein
MLRITNIIFLYPTWAFNLPGMQIFPPAVRATLGDILRYLACSPLSRPRQFEALRELDARLQKDVGLEEALARRAAVAPWE